MGISLFSLYLLLAFFFEESWIYLFWSSVLNPRISMWLNWSEFNIGLLITDTALIEHCLHTLLPYISSDQESYVPN